MEREFQALTCVFCQQAHFKNPMAKGLRYPKLNGKVTAVSRLHNHLTTDDHKKATSTSGMGIVKLQETSKGMQNKLRKLQYQIGEAVCDAVLTIARRGLPFTSMDHFMGFAHRRGAPSIPVSYCNDSQARISCTFFVSSADC